MWYIVSQNTQDFILQGTKASTIYIYKAELKYCEPLNEYNQIKQYRHNVHTNTQHINNDNDSIVEFPNVLLKFDITRSDCPLRQDWFMFADDIIKTKTFRELLPLVGPIMSSQGIGEFRIMFHNMDDNSNLIWIKNELYKCDILFHKIPRISFYRGQKRVNYIYKAESII